MNCLVFHCRKRLRTAFLMALPQRSSMGSGRRFNKFGLPAAYAFAIGNRIATIIIGLDKDMPDKFHPGDAQYFQACTLALQDGYLIIDSNWSIWIEAWHRMDLLWRLNHTEEGAKAVPNMEVTDLRFVTAEIH